MIERHWNADRIAMILGIAFLAVGAMGFTPNPIVSETGVFQVNDVHNFAHILTGVLFLAGAFLGAPVATIRGIAILYLVVAVAGFVSTDSMLFRLVEVNAADRWLHAGLAAILLVAGFATPIEERMSHARM